MGLSPVEIAVVVIVVALLFGKRLPELGSGLGQAISNFKKSYKDASSIDTASSSIDTQSAGPAKSTTVKSDDIKV